VFDADAVCLFKEIHESSFLNWNTHVHIALLRSLYNIYSRTIPIQDVSDISRGLYKVFLYTNQS